MLYYENGKMLFNGIFKDNLQEGEGLIWKEMNSNFLYLWYIKGVEYYDNGKVKYQGSLK